MGTPLGREVDTLDWVLHRSLLIREIDAVLAVHIPKQNKKQEMLN